MGELTVLLIGVVDALFAFFVVAPMLLNTASLFGVQKQFAKAMVEEGVIDEATVKQLHPKKQIAGVLISLVLFAVLIWTCFIHFNSMQAKPPEISNNSCMISTKRQ